MKVGEELSSEPPPSSGVRASGADEPNPSLLSDGTHVYPVFGVHVPNYGVDGAGAGTVRWHPKRGISFEIECPSDLESNLALINRPQGASGTFSEVSQIPELTGWVPGIDSVIRLFVVKATRVKSVEKFGTADRSVQRVVSGRAAYASVELPLHHSLTLSYESSGASRFLLPDFSVLPWPREDLISWSDSEALHSALRHWLVLSEEPSLVLYSSTMLGEARDAAWLAFEETPAEDSPGWLRSEACLEAVSLLSFVSGKRLSFLLKDRVLDEGRILWTYFGSPLLDDLGGVATGFQPVPLRGSSEAFQCGHEVATELPAMLVEYRHIRKWYDLDWIVGPLWYALDVYLDDKLALASVALERLAAGYARYFKDLPPEAKKKAKFWTASQSKRIRRALKEAVRLFAEEHSIDLEGSSMRTFAETVEMASEAIGEQEAALFGPELLSELRERMKNTLRRRASEDSIKLDESKQKIIASRIDRFGEATNRDKLVLVFEHLGIELSEREIETIDRRNDCLHGRRTLEDPVDLGAIAEEHMRFDILRTAINKAVLTLLGYRGPYVNYATRKPSGGYPVQPLSLGPEESLTLSDCRY
jgi:hypothetical protein